MKLIELTQGRFAKVDDADFELVNQFNWYFQKNQYNSNGYALRWVVREDGSKVRQWMEELVFGSKDGFSIDHANGDSIDNQKSNLRHATKQQQMSNRGHRGGFKGRRYKGVYRSHSISVRWEAQIRVNKKCIQIGSFGTQEEAALAYNKAATKYFGEFALLNVLDSNASTPADTSSTRLEVSSDHHPSE